MKQKSHKRDVILNFSAQIWMDKKALKELDKTGAFISLWFSNLPQGQECWRHYSETK